MIDTLESQVFDTISIRGVEKQLASLSSVSMLDSAQRQLLLASGTYLGREVPSGGLYMSDGGHVDMFTKTSHSDVAVSTVKEYTEAGLFNAMAYDGVSTYAIVSQNADMGISYSTDDGVTWDYVGGGYPHYSLICWAGDRFVINEGFTDKQYYTTDFVNLTQCGTYSGCNGIFYNDGRTFFFNDRATSVYYTDDFDEFKSVAVPAAVYGKCFAVAPNGNMLVSGNGSYVLKSTDNGNSWTKVDTPALFSKMAYGAGLFVVPFENKIYTSPDGATWTERPLTISATVNDIKYTGEIFVMTRNGYITTSTDGINWTDTSVSGTHACVAGKGDTFFFATQYKKVSKGVFETTYEYNLTPVAYGKSETDAQLSTKQGVLKAGANITIDENNVISATGGGSDPSYDPSTRTITL